MVISFVLGIAWAGLGVGLVWGALVVFANAFATPPAIASIKGQLVVSGADHLKASHYRQLHAYAY